MQIRKVLLAVYSYKILPIKIYNMECYVHDNITQLRNSVELVQFTAMSYEPNKSLFIIAVIRVMPLVDPFWPHGYDISFLYLAK
jgi:hypothetical protein